MTNQLKRAFDAASCLPQGEQDALAEHRAGQSQPLVPSDI